MTEEMLKSLPIGTRLNGVGKYGGPDLNEQGTYMGFDKWTERAIVEWDNYIADRHTCGGRVKEGHGWWVPACLLSIVEDIIDLGELTPNLVPDSINELLGGFYGF